jgi:hypothetical protein
MQLIGRRKKKLIVAFHFHIAAPRGWDCDECRRLHLEVKRRCGFVPEAQLTEVRPVWVRGTVETESCPKSVVSAQSLEWLEEFAAWRGGYVPQVSLAARQIEAFQLLEDEVLREAQHARQKTAKQNVARDFSRKEERFGD